MKDSIIRKVEREWRNDEYDEAVTETPSGFAVEGFDQDVNDPSMSVADLKRLRALLDTVIRETEYDDDAHAEVSK